MATLTLQGIVRITASGTYDFVLPIQTGTNLPNALDNQVLEEVIISIESPAANVTINLPSISSFNNAWNTKIYINNQFANPLILNSYDDETEVNYINLSGDTNINIAKGRNAYVRIINDNIWSCWLTTAPNP